MINAGPTPPPQDRAPDKTACRLFKNGDWSDLTDSASPEVRVNIRWPGAEPAVLWAHPHRLEELALGHALVELCAPGAVPALETIDSLTFSLGPRPAPAKILLPRPLPLSPQHLVQAMERFTARPEQPEAQGCLHCAALLEPYSGQFLKFAWDMDCNNCVDRLAGWSFAEGVARSMGVVFVSAPITASLAAKLAKAGFSAVISPSAVTSGGVEIARNSRMALAGLAAPGQFTVFTDRAERFQDRDGAARPEAG